MNSNDFDVLIENQGDGTMRLVEAPPRVIELIKNTAAESDVAAMTIRKNYIGAFLAFLISQQYTFAVSNR